jgi:hypothetical protein
MRASISSGVLIEWQAKSGTDRDKLAFSHHVVFDFAVSTLLFRGDDDTLFRALLEDPQLVLIARPSIVFHYHHVWSQDGGELKRFWTLVFTLQGEALPSIGKLIGPSVAVERAVSVSQFSPLIQKLSKTGQLRDSSERILNYVAGSLLSGDRLLFGDGAGPWCEFAKEISLSLTPSAAYDLRALLMRMLDKAELLTEEQLGYCGVASRNLLEFAWSQPKRDRYIVIAGLDNVCKTHRSAPAASSELLRRALKPEHVAQFGFEELPWIARQLAPVLTADPALVEDVYVAAFGYVERSTEAVPMGSSRLLPLTSTRKQDFEGARWELGRFFPKFMSSDPIRATSALIRCVDAFVVNDRRASRLAPATSEEVEFELLGVKAKIALDYSSIWDRDVVGHKDDIVVMLDGLSAYLKGLGHSESTESEFNRLMVLLASENRWAVVWRRLLSAATEDPNGLGIKLKDFAFARPILTGIDTSWAAGEFLHSVYPILSRTDKERAEEAILGIVQADGLSQSSEAMEHQRDRLLGRLPRDQLTLKESMAVVDALVAGGGVPANPPPFRMEISSAPFGEKEFLAEEGVQVESEQNRRVQDLEVPIKDFGQKYMNAEPTDTEVQKVAGPLELLWRELLSAETNGVDPKQSDYAWGVLAEACSSIAAMRTVPCSQTPYSMVREILLAASLHHMPAPDPDSDLRFDEMQSWGGPAARIAATAGLVRLSARSSCSSQAVLNAVERLSGDPVPAVRFQVAFHLNALYDSGRDIMWRLVERFAETDPSRGVVHGLIVGSFQALARVEPDRIALLVQKILDRTVDGPGSARVREAAVETLSGLFLWRGTDLAAKRVDLIVEAVPIDADNAGHVLSPVRQALTYGPVAKPDPESEAVRGRAFSLTRRLLVSALSTLESLEKQERPSGVWSDQDQAVGRGAGLVIDHIAREIYFASGAFKQEPDDDHVPSQACQERFYHEAKETIDLLCSCGIPSVAHHLLETLEGMIAFDQRDVFLQIGRVVEGGKRGGYQYESMAADLSVRLVERYLAEYRSLLETDDECRRVLIAVLDTFISAGWPAALRLSYRLQDIFR